MSYPPCALPNELQACARAETRGPACALPRPPARPLSPRLVSGTAGFCWAGRGYAPTMAKKILALVSEPGSGEALKQAIGRERADTAEVLVGAPALTTRRRFW